MKDPQLRCRWYSFSLRTLFVMVTAVALLVGWLVRSDITVTAVPEKTEFMLGEPGYVLFKVNNRSAKNLRLIVEDNPSYETLPPKSLQIEILDAQGKAIPLLNVLIRQLNFLPPLSAHELNFLQPPSARDLPAGGQYVFYVLLNDFAKFEKPGRYTVRINGTLLITPEDRSVTTTMNVKAKVYPVRASTTIMIVPHNATRMGKIIAELGNAMFDLILPSETYIADVRAQNALATVRDDRVIPYFVRLAREGSGISRCLACRVLGKFDSDEALNTLEYVMKTAALEPGDDLSPIELRQSVATHERHAAIQAIANSPHSHALPLLWKFADDCDWGVRQLILDKAVELKTFDARAVIEKMTMDESERIRNAAINIRRHVAND